jgi:hypothetical protein
VPYLVMITTQRFEIGVLLEAEGFIVQVMALSSVFFAAQVHTPITYRHELA